MHLNKKAVNREKGAITVFLALIFMSIIVFAGAVIDIVRIAAADRKVQSALNSSARSVLAGYDKDLAGEYGIYGVNTSASAVKDDFFRYISVNLKERHEGISFINISVDRGDIEIHGMESLLSDEVFKRQVQEYMKYRVPVTGTLELVEQLKDIKLREKLDYAKSEKVTRDKAKELRTKAREVNSRLAGIKKKAAYLSADKLEDLSKDLSQTLTLSGIIFDGSGKSLLEHYNESRQDSNIKAKVGECIENRSEEFAKIEEDNRNLVPELRDCLAEVNKTLAEVKPLLRDLKELKEELGNLKDVLSDLRDELSDLRESKNSSSERIAGIKNEIAEVRAEIDEVEGKIESLDNRIDREISELKAKIERFSLEGYTIKDESVELSYKETEKLKRSIEQIKENIMKVLIKSLEKDWLISAEEFEKEALINGEDFAGMEEKVHYSPSMQEAEAEKSNDRILEGIEKLSKAVEEAALVTVEKINTIEYVMDKYTFLTSQTERNHYFKKGEVEYIICGTDIEEEYSRLKNTEYYVVAKVFLQVWALRFAIDAIDNFIRSAIIFPPQRLAFALAEGALDASLDMLNMLKGEGVALCPKSFTGVRLKYSDHLRLLLLMKPEEEILRKSRQLMQANIRQAADTRMGYTRTDFRLGDYNTAISASVTARLNLFFLPMLKIDRLLPGSFEGGSYIIRKQIYVGY